MLYEMPSTSQRKHGHCTYAGCKHPERDQILVGWPSYCWACYMRLRRANPENKKTLPELPGKGWG